MKHSSVYIASITRSILLFLAGVLLAAPGKAGAVEKPAVVSVDAPVTGEAARVGESADFYDLPLVRGQLLYAFDTAVYDQIFHWPWDAYLVLRPFGKHETGQVASPLPNSVTSWKVNLIPHEFMYQPYLSPDGETVAFKTGDITSNYSTYVIHLYSLRNRVFQTIDAPKYNVWEWPVFWSPNSRYLAYFRGGFGSPFGGWTLMELWVYDLQTRRSRFIARHEDLYRQVVWTSDNQLLYSTFPDPSEMREGKLASLYRADPRGDKPAVYVLDDAVYPMLSPDGRWIAAFSLWDERDKAFADKPRGAGNAPPEHGLPPGKDSPTRRRQRQLMVFPSAGGKPILVNAKADFHGSYLLWSPDGAHLYRLSKRYDSKEKATARIYDFALETRQEREIATFAYDTYGNDMTTIWPTVMPLRVSRDGRYLYYSQMQRPGGTYLRGLDLQTHEIITVCRVRKIRGLDWLDESSPAVKAPSER